MQAIKTLDQKSKILKKGMPLSCIQKDLWAIQQLAPKSYAYNTLFSARITSKVTLAAVRKFFQLFIDRHEILRSNFYQQDGVPYQTISKQNIYFQEIDASKWTEKQLENETQKAYREPFDLEKDQLFRVFCFYQNPNSTILLISTHHIISDAWSIAIIIDELTKFYPQIACGAPIITAKLKHQYQDFINWQQQFLESAEAKEQMNYWKNLIGEKSSTLNISQKNTNQQLKLEGKTHFFKIETVEQIKEFCKAEGTTLNSFFQSIFHTLLHRYSQSNSVLSLSPRYARLRTTAGLSRSDFIDNFGCFVNAVLNKTELTRDLTFLELLAIVQERNKETLKNQDYPFPLLKKQLGISQPQISYVYQKRGKGQNDLSMFLFDINEAKSIQAGTLELQPYYLKQQEGQFEIVFEVLEANDVVYCNLKYQTHLFNENFIARMSDHLKQIIKSVLATPQQKVTDIEILTPLEKQQLLFDFNNTTEPYPKEKTINQLFEEQAELNPENIAVVFKDQKLTYQELNNKANQIANNLIELGIGPNIIVGIMVERSLEMITGTMAILKAGGAYLPIDPKLPKERIQYMLEDSNVEILLTQSHLNHAQFGEKKVIYLDKNSQNELMAAKSNRASRSSATACDLAYVIYTSGTTGKPKGTLIKHSSLVNTCLALIKTLDIKASDRNSQFLNFIFDAGMLEIFQTLVSGASLFIIPEELKNNAAEFENYLIKEKITILTLTPSYLTLLDPKKEYFFKHIITGGEALTKGLVSKWKRYNLVNEYGPSECAICATLFQPNHNEGIYQNHHFARDFSEIPIGKPIANTKVFILSKNQQLQPVGLPGELCIAGAGLATGYLNNPVLTATKFITNPLNPKEKLYKTGDLAAWLENGNIEFLGRMDNQIKIRGFRVEISDIEANILKYEDIKEAAVIVKNKKGKGNYLIAFLTPKSTKTFNLDDFKKFLSKNLPDYMLPSYFICLQRLPLTINGKIDRAFLANQIIEKKQTEESIVPKTETEQKIATIWQKILNIQNIELDDNFFQIGGDSLLIIQLLLELNKNFALNIDMQDIFQNLKLRELASFIDSLKTGNSSQNYKINFKAETILDDDIYPVMKNTNIFLSGATGFLGSYLMADLLTNHKTKIYALVRAKNITDGLNRLQEKLLKIDRWQDNFKERIIPILGDLTKPFLGINQETWIELEETIDLIYHNGALVNFIYPYSQLKSSNVLGTKDILRLAFTGKIKPLFYISTLSVFESVTFEKQIATEEDPLNHEEGLYFGYPQSKWIAEKLVLEAKNRGLPICIFRPGRITGEVNGRYLATEELFARFIKGVIQLKYLPNLDLLLDLIPVDFTSQLIIKISSRMSLLNKVYHLINPQKFHLKELQKWLQNLGYEIDLIPYQEWCQKLSDSPNNELAPLMPLFTKPIFEGKTVAELSSSKSYTEFSVKNIKSFLDNKALALLNNEVLLTNYIRYFQKTGFLPMPKVSLINQKIQKKESPIIRQTTQKQNSIEQFISRQSKPARIIINQKLKRKTVSFADLQPKIMKENNYDNDQMLAAG